ncbi:hypothetical protein L6164_037861 [Bauhinia variegata]|uniref:Uncharacterized protein n=1 Tax=Bauhinia variegata TaxID=167791 RepID=A0ACB9KLP0_BAUVA|nr:hypothetical protein L6164_037861 [Bauhinia variegata]
MYWSLPVCSYGNEDGPTFGVSEDNPLFSSKTYIQYKRDDYSDVLVQIYLSFGTLAKVVCLAKKVSKDTFSSIITPVLDLDSVLSLMSDIKVVLPDISQRYMPWVSRIPLHQGLKWEPTWKALPTHKLTETMHPPHVFTEDSHPMSKPISQGCTWSEPLSELMMMRLNGAPGSDLGRTVLSLSSTRSAGK